MEVARYKSTGKIIFVRN